MLEETKFEMNKLEKININIWFNGKDFKFQTSKGRNRYKNIKKEH